MSADGRSALFAWLFRGGVCLASAITAALFILIPTASVAWAGNGNDGNSGNPGPGTPGDANDHCQSSKCSGGDSDDPDPDPEPEPEPEPAPDPPSAGGGDSGGESPSSGSGSSGGDNDTDSDDDDSTSDRDDSDSAGNPTRPGSDAPDTAEETADFYNRSHVVLQSHPHTKLTGPGSGDLLTDPNAPLIGVAIAGVTGLAVAARRPGYLRGPAGLGGRAAVAGLAGMAMMGARRPGGMGEFVEHADGLAREDLDRRVGVGWGDKSWTWRFPGRPRTDAASTSVPPRLNPLSPFLARIANDGSEFRAMFGSLWLLTPLAGAAVGVMSGLANDAQPLPPPVLLLAAGIVIATFDALSGAVAALAFTLTCLLGGGLLAEGDPTTLHALLVVLAVTFLWCSLPIIGSAVRPFRRVGSRSLRYTWDRAADLAISSLLCAWIAGKMVEAMDIFAGMPTGLPRHQTTIALVTLAAVATRIGAEQMTTALYPRRLLAVEPDGPFPEQHLLAQLGGAVVRTSIFSFMGFAFTGVCWQWLVGTIAFLLPQVSAVFSDRFRKIGIINRLVPRGIVEIFILIVACTLAANLVISYSTTELAAVRWVFLALSLPPAIIGLLAIFAKEEEGGLISLRPWVAETLGLVVFVATTWLALRGWSY